MASGHSSFGTFHAGSVETLIRRLETPPINLSPSLIESLDVVCVMTHVKELDKNLRRMKELVEIKGMPSEIGKVEENIPFEWDPITDKIIQKGNFILFEKVSKRTGVPIPELNKELELRAMLLQNMANRKIQDFDKVNQVIKEYYIDKNKVLREFRIL